MIEGLVVNHAQSRGCFCITNVVISTITEGVNYVQKEGGQRSKNHPPIFT